MKLIKTSLLMLAFNFWAFTTFAQDAGKVAGASCHCGNGQSTCNSNCTFSDCCICWNPESQNGACGCYWGIASCKSGKIEATKGTSLNDNIWEDVDPAATITFHFDKFRKLSSFFLKNNIKINDFDIVVNETSKKYYDKNDNAKIGHEDFILLLKEYSNLINQLDEETKYDLNLYIQTIQ